MANDSQLVAALAAADSKATATAKQLAEATKGRPKIVGHGVGFAIAGAAGASLGATKAALEEKAPQLPPLVVPATVAVGTAALGLGVKNADAKAALYETGKAATAVLSHELSYTGAKSAIAAAKAKAAAA